MRNVVIVVHAYEHLFLRSICYVVLLQREESKESHETGKQHKALKVMTINIFLRLNEADGTHRDGVAGVKLSCSHWLPVVGYPQLDRLRLMAPK